MALRISGEPQFSQLDPFGNPSSYRYDQRFNRTGALDAEKRLTTWDYNAVGQLTARKTGASDESWTYDAAGNVATHTGGESDKTILGYNAKNQLTSVKDPLGKTSIFSYFPDTGLLESATSAGGKTTRYGYDTAGNQTSITTAEGKKTTFTHYAAGQVKTATEPRGNAAGADPAKFTTAFTYDAADRPKTVKDARGNSTTYDYDLAGNLAQVTDAKTRITRYDYDDAGRLSVVTDPAGKTMVTGYDKAGRTASVTDRTGAKTTYGYDKAGNRVETVTARGNAPGATKAAYTWKTVPDKVGSPKTVTDPLGKTSKFGYDADNRPTSTTNPLGHTRTVAYDDNGNVTQANDGLNQITAQLVYDKNGRLISSASQNNYKTTYEYDDDGNLTAQVSPLTERTTFGYDGDGLRTSMVDPRGNVTGADAAKYTWTYGYNEAGHATSVTDPLGNKRTTGYDAAGNADTSTDARGKKTLYGYDELDRVNKVTGPDGAVTAYGYDTAGYLTTKTDANKNVTTYGNDAEGRVTSTKDPLARTVTSQYDPEGHQGKVTNARGQSVTLTTDARGLPTKVAYSDGTPATSVKYDDASRPVEATDATGTRTLNYHDDNQLATVTSPGATKPFKYNYNTDGSLEYRYDPQGGSVFYKYDKNGRVSSQRFNSKTVAYGYDAAGNPTGTTLPTTTARSESRTYDTAGRLASVTTPSGTNALTLDADGRVIADKKGSGFPTRYAYDDAGRVARNCTDTTATSCLTGTTGSTYKYDPVGNIKTSATGATTTTNTYDAADQLKQSVTGTTTTAFGYDADGNQTKDGSDTYVFDPAGRVKSATIGANAYTFLNDADGNRTTTKKNGALDRTTRWDSNNQLPLIAADSNGAGTLLGQYQYGPDGAPQSMGRSATADFYFTHDQQSSVQGVYDTTGTENYRYSYSPWGKATGTAGTGTKQTSPFGFTGQSTDPSLPDRLLLRARSYDTAQGRFTSTDPIPAGAGNLNQAPYNYADNDPVNLSDPSGLCPLCISAAVGGVLGGIIGGATYALTHEGDFQWGDFAASTGKGALIGVGAGLLAPVGGGFAASLGLSGGRALATAATVNAGIGMGYTWGVNTVQCQPTTPFDLLLGGLGGGLGTLIGPAWNGLKGLFAGAPGAARPGGLTLDFPPYGPSVRGPASAKKGPNVLETSTAPPGWTHAGQLKQAESMLEGYALKNYSSKHSGRTYVGGYNTQTGEIAIGSSGGKFPGVSYCAEGNVCYALGGDATKIRFTNAYTVKKGEGANLIVKKKPVCVNCQADYPSPFQFQPGVQHDSPGPWDAQNY
ncbi:RHS repeat-associated core domain-containing protein [Streptomyces sp. 21So2-11]|uniref:RHS repeat-associated core domain-containing protein n=1 Tax=Streptomyces sp. 21So2-11 TaxID=3144408 RepID=UPI00321AD92B